MLPGSKKRGRKPIESIEPEPEAKSDEEDDEPVTKRGRRSSTNKTPKGVAATGRRGERDLEAGKLGEKESEVESGADEGDQTKRGELSTAGKLLKKRVSKDILTAKENKKRGHSAKEPETEIKSKPATKRGKNPTTKTKKPGKKARVVKEEEQEETEARSGSEAEDVATKKIPVTAGTLSFTKSKVKPAKTEESEKEDKSAAEEEDIAGSDDDIKPAIAEKARKAVAKTLLGSKLLCPYPDWSAGSPTPYGALVKTLTLVEGTTKRLEKLSYASLFLRQVLRLTPDDLLTVIHLMTNKLAADYEGVELGIGETLLMKAIGESCGRSMDKIREDQKEIGDLGMVAMKSRNNQGTLFKPKPLTIKSVHQGLLEIATVKGEGGQGRKIASINKLLAAAKGDEAKYLVRGLEGKLRTGLAENTIIVAVSQAQIVHEMEAKGEKATVGMLTEAELKLRSVFRYVRIFNLKNR